MDKKIIYIVGGLVILGGIIFLFTKGGAVTNSNNTLNDSVRVMIASGASKQCNFSESTDTSKTDGVIYIGSGKMRGDFTSVAAEITTKAHMVISNDYTYTWVDGMNTGFKVAISSKDSESKTNQPLNIDSPQNITCTPWITDDTKFNLPTNISFPTLPTAAQSSNTGASTGGSAGTALQCGYCNNLPATEKAQCRSSLKCQ